MNLTESIASMPLFHNSPVAWLIAAVTGATLFFSALALRGVVRRYHKRLLATEKTEIAEIPVEILSRTTVLFFVVLSIFAGLSTLTMSPRTEGAAAHGIDAHGVPAGRYLGVRSRNGMARTAPATDSHGR